MRSERSDKSPVDPSNPSSTCASEQETVAMNPVAALISSRQTMCFHDSFVLF